MNEPVDLQSMDEAQMRQMLQHLMSELKHKQTLLDKLSYEMAKTRSKKTCRECVRSGRKGRQRGANRPSNDPNHAAVAAI